jgi:FlgD Ig-like domain
MVRHSSVFLIFAGLIALAPAHNIMIESREIPLEIDTYGRFQQNRALFMWQPFDSLRQHWNLTVYPGGQWSRVGLRDPNEGRPPAPESMAVDPPPPSVMELDTLGSGSIQWIYEDKDEFGLYIDGIDFTQQSFRFIGNYLPDANVYTTPIYHHAGWISAITWQYEIIPGVPYQATEQHTKTVLGKGKVKVPMSGEYYWPCLVIRDNMVFSDNLGTNDRRWIYEWVVPGHFAGANGVAAALSQNGASPDFINVETFMQLSSLAIPDWDVMPPVFSNTTVWHDTLYAGPFPVSSTITDDNGLGAESLFYRVNSGTWVSVGPDSATGSTCHFTIPAVTPPARVDYYVWAMDSFSLARNIEFWTTWPVCSPESTMVTFNAEGTGTAELEPAIPGRVGLAASPSPFQDMTTFYFSYPGAREATIRVFSSSGELVRTLEMQPMRGLGYQADWNGRDESGELLPAGTYLYRVESPAYTETRKVLLTR